MMSPGTFGDRLRREREMRGVTLEEISAATRISTRFLMALENEQWNQLPGGVFNRGFVRQVAHYLGLDEESLVAEYAAATNDKPIVAVWLDQPARNQRSAWPWVVLIVVVALAATGWLLWQRYGDALIAWRDPAPPPPPKIEPPAVTGSPANSVLSPAAEPATLELEIEVSAPRAVKVVADGEIKFNSQMRPGRSAKFTAKEHFEVSADNSGGVLLFLNGQLMPAMGLPDSPGSIKLDRADLKKALEEPH